MSKFDLPRGYTKNPLTDPPDPKVTGPATPPPPRTDRSAVTETSDYPTGRDEETP